MLTTHILIFGKACESILASCIMKKCQILEKYISTSFYDTMTIHFCVSPLIILVATVFYLYAKSKLLTIIDYHVQKILLFY
jgi:uncharacterized protein YybS (DUF2232 family)